jgi:hypothetical protein
MNARPARAAFAASIPSKGLAHVPQTGFGVSSFFFAIVTLPMGRRAFAHSFLRWLCVRIGVKRGRPHSFSEAGIPSSESQSPSVQAWSYPAVCLPPPPVGARYGLPSSSTSMNNGISVCAFSPRYFTRASFGPIKRMSFRKSRNLTQPRKVRMSLYFSLS